MGVSIDSVEALNQKALKLNNDRQRFIGAKEAAEKTYEKLVLNYKQKYGVDISIENIQEEYNKEYANMVNDYNRLKSQIESIENGDYKVEQKPIINFEEAEDYVRKNQLQESTVKPTNFDIPYVEDVASENVVNGAKPPINMHESDIDNSDDEDISEKPYTPVGWGSPSLDVNSWGNNNTGKF